eukprot:521514-Pyramimonas_sp.AAC.1
MAVACSGLIAVFLCFGAFVGLSCSFRRVWPVWLGGGSAASWMLVGCSWLAALGPAGGSFDVLWRLWGA